MRKLLTMTTRATTAAALLVAGTALVPGAGWSPAPGTGDPEVRLVAAGLAHPGGGLGADRRIVRYTVRPGDTATGLAVRFHAWTAELVGLNRLGPAGTLAVGQRLRIPVVVSAARAADRAGHHRRAGAAGRSRDTGRVARTRRATPRPPARSAGPRQSRPGRPSRARVKRVLVRTARSYGVDPHLALAVSWQEAGWQMHHVSAAHAIGAMQVLPPTGRWMSAYVGRPLRLHRLRDNAAAGVMLLRVLRGQAPLRRAVAGYYQGLAGVREHGMYADTRAYVRNVLALRRMLRGGWDPS